MILQKKIPKTIWIEIALLAIVLAVGLALRLWGIDERSVWHDEGHTLAFIRVPAADMNAILALDDHPPLYYWLLRGWMAIAGGVTWGRVFSALCSFLTLPLVYLLARRLTSRGVALGAMALLAISPQAVYYAQELRMYAPQSLLLTAMMLTAVIALRRLRAAPLGPQASRLQSNSLRATHITNVPPNSHSPTQIAPLAATAALGVLACYTHYFSGIYPLGFLVALLLVRRPSETQHGRGIVRAATFALLCGLLYLPWLDTGISHVLANSMGGMKASWTTTSPVQDIVIRGIETTLGKVHAFPFDAQLFTPKNDPAIRVKMAIATFGAIAILFAIGLFLLIRKKKDSAFWIAFLLIPAIIAIAYELAGGRFYPRFLLPVIPLGCICVAHAIAAMPRRWQRIAAAAFVASIMLASTNAMLRVDIRDVTRDAAAELQQLRDQYQGQPAETAPVLHPGAHSFWNLMAYDPTPNRHRLITSPNVPALATLMYGPQATISLQELTQYDQVWVAYSEWTPQPKLRQETEPKWFARDWRIAEQKAFGRFNKRIELVLYTRSHSGNE